MRRAPRPPSDPSYPLIDYFWDAIERKRMGPPGGEPDPYYGFSAIAAAASETMGTTIDRTLTRKLINGDIRNSNHVYLVAIALALDVDPVETLTLAGHSKEAAPGLSADAIERIRKHIENAEELTPEVIRRLRLLLGHEGMRRWPSPHGKRQTKNRRKRKGKKDKDGDEGTDGEEPRPETAGC